MGVKVVVACLLLGLAAGARLTNTDNTAVSPVQKVIELLMDNKMKVQADLDAESKEMAEYSEYCDTTTSDKNYAIRTATRTIANLEAAITDGESQVSMLSDEIATLGTQAAEKGSELSEATAVRKREKADFQGSEAELMTSVDQLERALVTIKREMSFVQKQDGKGAKHGKEKKRSQSDDLKLAMQMISKVLDAGWVSAGTKKTLQGLIQTSLDDKQGDTSSSDLVWKQPQPSVKAYESSSGGIVQQLEEMKSKAEETLSNARMGEMKEQHNFDMMAQSLTDALSLNKEKTSEAKHLKATTMEEMSKAKGELVETKKTKASDETFLASLSQECTEGREAWDERQKSAAGEMAALDKAKSILEDRVKVFLQSKEPTDMERHWNEWHEGREQDSGDARLRRKVVQKLKDLNREFSSYALMQMISSAGSDPFEKIKGLISEMVTKLINEANEEATQKAFCDEELSKSRQVQDEKSMTIDKLQSRLDKAATGKAELEQLVKELQDEIAKLDAGTAEATKLRTEEHATYLKNSNDFKVAAEATTQAIGVLKEYYESALVQTHSSRGAQPAFGGAKSDAAASIISILEMCEENFTKLYMEEETGEQSAKMAYDKLMQENKVSKASKEAEIKGSLSEIKSLTVTITNSKEDYDMTSKELDAVMAYLEKLKPQCETKVMSYAEKKARREAEIDGLKEALSILDSDAPALLQRKNLRVHRH